ncbi:uncharacterized protein FTOL_03247 [Fusarium torulosum]|uniref:Uncharacterized protein n=1 Tax=Fusarium torulosum TaxID=33205 RepID=A0AAE8SFI1_9HYPO|nr:uncharacterized protein FTOL_03247 [Fusarium torulosum]
MARKNSATAELHTLARTTRSTAAAAEQDPVLTFLPHQGLTSSIQPRTVEPRPPKATDKIKVSDFQRDWKLRDGVIVDSFVAGFQVIENNIAPLLVDELVKFLVDTWREDQRDGSEKSLTPKEHRLYNTLTSKDEATKSLNYAYWYYLAAWYGPGHPDLKTIRNDISAVWGVDFPTDAMFYPHGISDKHQKRLYAGIGLVFESEASGSPGGHPTPRPRAPSGLESSVQQPAPKAQAPFRPAIQTRDTQVEARQQEIVNAIENNPVGSVLGKFVPNINPKFLKSTASANENNLKKLKSELSATRRELEQSNTKVAILEENLDSLQDTHHATQQKVEGLENGLERVQKDNKQLQNQNTQLAERLDKVEGNLNRSKKYASDLEGKLDKADDRMDALENKLEEANERAKKAIEMSAFNHALIEERIKEEIHDEDDDEDES